MQVLYRLRTLKYCSVAEQKNYIGKTAEKFGREFSTSVREDITRVEDLFTSTGFASALPQKLGQAALLSVVYADVGTTPASSVRKMHLERLAETAKFVGATPAIMVFLSSHASSVEGIIQEFESR